MRDASLAILEAVRGALVADADVADLVGTKIASSWSHVLAPPYLRIRVGDVLQFEADSADGPEDGGEHVVTVHCFTKEPAPIVLHDLASKVRDALQDRDNLTLDDADLWMIQWRGTIKRQDPDDPALQMAVVTFSASSTTQ